MFPTIVPPITVPPTPLPRCQGKDVGRRTYVFFENTHRLRVARGFTLIELLVVMSIMAVLAAAVVVATSTVLEQQKIRNTRTVLQIVADAVEEFKREQTASGTITKNRAYRRRFDLYPPDELEWFTPARPGGGSLAPGGAVMFPVPPNSGGYNAMRFYTDGTSQDFEEFRDQVAMIVAIEELGDASASMLDRLDDRSRKSVTDPATSLPAVFLDRNQDGAWDTGDRQIRYIVDAWGTPISYLAQRDYQAATGADTASNNHDSWNEASTEIIKLNHGQPVVFSYGPDGQEQLTQEIMDGNGNTAGLASLTGDFEDANSPNVHGRVQHMTNQDNVYLDVALLDRLAAESPPAP